MNSNEDVRARARELSHALKGFHRALIRAEVGNDPNLQNPYTQLFALIGDPRFAWMSGLSGLITRIDGAIGEDEIGTPGLFETFLGEAAALLGEDGDPQFRIRHLAALQTEPEVGLATGALRKTLAKLR